MIESIDNRIEKIHRYFLEHGIGETKREHLYARALKLNEEAGELCEAILHEHDARQRNKDKEIDLDNEIADVIIVSLLIASLREKNVWDTLDKKLDKQMKRFNLE